MVQTLAVAINNAVSRARRGGWRVLWARLWPESGAAAPIPALDGLRAIAVLMVMAFHAWTFVPGVAQVLVEREYQSPIDYGRTGVQLFFVLSGFLLFQPYAQWLFGIRPRPSTRLFYQRRALRVGPAYWVNIVVLVLASPARLALLGSGAVIAYAAWLGNVFTNAAMDGLNNVWWTMAVEVQFYAALPAIAWLIVTLSRRLHRVRAAVVVVAGLFFISGVCTILEKSSRFNVIPGVSSWLIDRGGLPYWVAVFGIGILCSIGYTYVTKGADSGGALAARARAGSTWICVAGVLFGVGLVFVPVLKWLPGKNQLIALTYGALLWGVLFGSPILRRVLASRPLRFLGLISYSLYLWHRVVLQWLIEPHLIAAIDPTARTLIGFALDVLVAVPIAYSAYWIAEYPFFRARQRAHESADPAEAPSTTSRAETAVVRPGT